MNNQDSFEYIFKDLLKLIRPIPVEYGHTLILFEEDYEESRWDHVEKPYWVKNVFFVSNIDTQIETVRKQIQINRIDIDSIITYFIEQVQSINENLKRYLSVKITFQNLVDNKFVELKNTGKSCPQLGWYTDEDKNNLEFPEIPKGEKEFTPDDFFNMCQSRFSEIVNKLDDLIMFLKHQVNISNNSTTKVKVGTSKLKTELKENLIKGELSNTLRNLIDYAEESKAMDLNDESIQLFSRLNTYLKKEREGIISHENSQIEISQIRKSILELINQI